jgi:hypothetical protein
MSLLPSEVHVAVNQLLVGLQASDNLVRTQAEESLNKEWIDPRPEILLMALAEQIIAAEDVGVGSSCGTVFHDAYVTCRHEALPLFCFARLRQRREKAVLTNL